MAEETYRGYLIKGDGTFGYFGVHVNKGSGTVPMDLRGLFTSPTEARKAVDRSLNSLKGRKKNGKATVNG